MAKIKKIEPIVLDILKNNPEARGDDFILVFEVYKHYVVKDERLETICIHHKQLDLPSFETITRCRRKLQMKNPELASERVKQLRAEQEAEFKQYALEI